MQSPPPPPPSPLHRRRTLYLIRHGEALHNVKEREAQQAVLQEINQQGQQLLLSTEEIQRRLEEARQAVLQDKTLFDAPLTQKGRQQAKQAGQTLARIVQQGIAPPPTEAMVSPLTRCLQTAKIVLSQEIIYMDKGPAHCNNNTDNSNNDNNDNTDNDNNHNTDNNHNDNDNHNNNNHQNNPSKALLVHIRPEITERQTQYPPDTPQTPDQLYHWTQQQVLIHDSEHKHNNNWDDKDKTTMSTPTTSTPTTSTPTSYTPTFQFHAKALTGHALAVEESRTQLRQRAHKLFDVLMEMNHRHILIISHKGYLREMERGLLGLTDSPLFENAEVRVYRVVFTHGERRLNSVERLA